MNPAMTSAGHLDKILYAALTRPAKTGADVTVLEHLSHVLQVGQFLCDIANLSEVERNRVLLAAALHDIGKAITDATGQRWEHSRVSAELVPVLLANPVLGEALAEAGIDVDLDAGEIGHVYDLVAEHHHLRPATLLHTPAASLLLVADGVASALEEGHVGALRAMLSGYHQLALDVADQLGLAPWKDVEIHRIDLPKETISDLLLTEKIFEILVPKLDEYDLRLVMREAGTIWVAGSMNNAERLVDEEVSTGDIIEPDLLYAVYTRPGFPRVPRSDTRSLEYLLVDDRTACEVLRDVFCRRGDEVNQVLERHGLTFDVLTALADPEALRSPEKLAEILYQGIRGFFVRAVPETNKILPKTVVEVAGGKANEMDRLKAEAVRMVAEARPDWKDDAEIISRLIARASGGRSITNVIYARRIALEMIEKRKIRFRLREVARLDNIPLGEDPPPLSACKTKRLAPCANCGLRPAVTHATSLLMGPTEGDGLWAFAGARKRAKICAWCHTAAIADLPIAAFQIEGYRRVRELNYMLVRTALSKSKLISVLERLGLIDRLGAEELRREDGPEPLNDNDRALLEDLLGEVPDPDTPAGVAGALSNLRGKGVSAIVLPGSAPLATRAVFALPSAAFFGYQYTNRLPHAVLDLMAMGVIAVLAEKIAPATFSLRATTSRAHINIRAQTVDESELKRSRALWELAEFRRWIAARIPGLQSPDTLDINFVMDLREDPRGAATSLLRSIMRHVPPGANKLAARVIDLAQQIADERRDPLVAAAQEIARELMRAGFLSPSQSVVRPSRSGGWEKRSEWELVGVLRDAWRIYDEQTLTTWLGQLVSDKPNERERLERVGTRWREACGGDIARLGRMIAEQAPLLVLEAGRGIA